MKKLMIGFIVILGTVFFSTVFIIDMTEQAVILQFGKPVRTIKDPGLHFKLPIPFQNAVIFDNRLLEYDVPPEEILSKDKKSLIVDRRTCKKGLELLGKDKDWEPEVIYHLFSDLSIEALIYFLAVDSTDRANQYANIYFTQYCGQAELSLTGDDLVEMGLKPGPIFQSVFKALREAHVKGAIETRDDEVCWVKKEFLEQ